jgi:hypothetical protein
MSPATQVLSARCTAVLLFLATVDRFLLTAVAKLSNQILGRCFSLQLFLATVEKPLLPALEELIHQVSELHLSLQDFVRNGYTKQKIIKIN